jgi:hypothetical protein
MDFNEKSASTVLLVLLLADLAFITVHMFRRLSPYLADPMFDIETDRGYAEMYQYLKYVGMILIFACLCIKGKTLLFLPWALLFAYFVADDALQMHELVGRWIGEMIPFRPPFRLRKDDLGELVVTMTAGLVLMPSFAAAYYFGSRPARKIFHDLFLLMGLLLAFAVGVDMVHSAYSGSPRIELYLGLIEDGGEMVAVSLFAWYAFLLLRRSPAGDAYLLNMFIPPAPAS